MIEIREISVPEFLNLYSLIEEFDIVYTEETLAARYEGKEFLLIGAFLNGEGIGCMAAYECDGSFYCWLAGVAPQFRRQGALHSMMGHLVNWARAKGYGAITIKTMNKWKGMLLYLIKNDFRIIHFDEAKGKISLEKSL